MEVMVILTWKSKFEVNSKNFIIFIIFSIFFSDYNEFLEDLEEDPDMRQNVNIFKDAKKQTPQIAVDTDDMADSALPEITLEEMLDDLVIGDVEMGEA